MHEEEVSQTIKSADDLDSESSSGNKLQLGLEVMKEILASDSVFCVSSDRTLGARHDSNCHQLAVYGAKDGGIGFCLDREGTQSILCGVQMGECLLLSHSFSQGFMFWLCGGLQMAKSYALLKWLAIIVLWVGVHALRLSMLGEDVFMSVL